MSATYLPTELVAEPLFYGALGRAAQYRSPLEGRSPAAYAPPAAPQPDVGLGDSLGQPAKSMPSPEQTLGAMARSAAFGLGFATNPIAAGLGAFGALGLADALGQKPSFSPRSVAMNAITNPLDRGPLVTDKPVAALDIGTPTPSFGEFGYGDLGDKVGGSLDINSNDPQAGGQKGADPNEGGVAAGPGDKGNPDGGDKGFAGGGYVGGGGALLELAGGGKVAIGVGGGLDDLIPTSIDGRRAAKLSDGEFVIPADVVSMMGDGSTRAGSQRLYDLVKNVRSEKTGTSQQAGPLPVGDILRRIFK